MTVGVNIFDILGLSGAFVIAFTYFYSQYRGVFLNSPRYYLYNILGSSLIILSLVFSAFNVSAFVIESLWIAVSIYGVVKNKPTT